MTGKQSLLFDKDVYVRCAATVVGKKEADGPLGEMFDVADRKSTRLNSSHSV